MNSEREETKGPEGLIQFAGLLAGPLLSIVFLLYFDLDPEHPEITRTAAVAILMAVWWITEAIPLAVTSLLPVVLYPALGIMSGKIVAPIYFNHIIFLFIGGFIVALAMERWELHRRIALRILLLFGVHPLSILMGFMVATWFLSMWISNTAATMMMVPIVLAIIIKLEESIGKEAVSRYSVGLFLGVAYSASIGGIATLVGTPPNLSFARIFAITFPGAPEISFATWFVFALPISVIFLGAAWFFLSLLYCRVGKFSIDIGLFRDQYRSLGPIAFEEGVVLANFLLLALLWLTRSGITVGSLHLPGWSALFPNKSFLNDGTVAIAIAIILFLIPAKKAGVSRVMDWGTASRLPWNIVLLFGGGFALATGFKESGLSMWLGHQMESVSTFHPILIIASICFIITFLTEFTSNTATAEMLLPILAALAVAINVNPLLLMIPGTLACSFAFMLPVATPPNAIIFGTNRIRISHMARAGIFLNLLGVFVITLATYLLGMVVFDIDLTQFPTWAVIK
ncbi:MAG: SLC13/DASS family transporter [Deltaproteobacteria bacterium]|nr:SLC13/DASS family transporter [Deltaproteobacteria bacterium]